MVACIRQRGSCTVSLSFLLQVVLCRPRDSVATLSFSLASMMMMMMVMVVVSGASRGGAKQPTAAISQLMPSEHFSTKARVCLARLATSNRHNTISTSNTTLQTFYSLVLLLPSVCIRAHTLTLTFTRTLSCSCELLDPAARVASRMHYSASLCHPPSSTLLAQ